jgi:Zn-dependent peptidase ImmA (M78 family)/transcriptional regulator with XRE-family HTH domain
MSPSPTTNKQFQELFGERLRRGRALRGLSLRALSEKLGGIVSHAALQKYEKGEMAPNSEVLLGLSDALEVRPDYFFELQPVTLSAIEFRKKVAFGKTKQAQVIGAAQEHLERYLEVERMLEIKNPPLKPFDLTALSEDALGDAVENAAAKLRDTWRLGCGPLANAHELLEDHGVKVFEVDADESFDGLSGWADAVPVVVLASWMNDDPTRKRFTALHELGHLAMRLPSGLGKKEEERLCHRFAGAVLIPKEMFLQEFGEARQFRHMSLQEPLAMKAQWGISVGAIMYRAMTLGLMTASSHVDYCIWARQRGWHVAEPKVWKGCETASRFKQLVHRASAQELITRSKAAGLLNQSLDEFDRDYRSAE